MKIIKQYNNNTPHSINLHIHKLDPFKRAPTPFPNAEWL